MSLPFPHPDDIFHVLLDALDVLNDSEEREPWLAYDDDVTPLGTSMGYFAAVKDAIRFARRAIGHNLAESVLIASIPPDKH